jgi:hypothetical protein
MEAYETHEIFFKKITRNKMNELLNRISTGYLENQINEKLIECYAKTNLSNDCKNIYINFKDINQKNIGHISFHLNKENKKMNNYSRKKGRIHIVNNRNTQKYYTLRVNSKNELISLSINSSLKMSNMLKECISIALEMINLYLDINSEYSLKYKLTEMKNTENKCLHIIESISKQKSYRSTPKQKTTIIRIPKQDSFSWKK